MNPLISSIAGVVTKPLTKLGQKYIERKTNQDTLKSKAVLAKQADATQITLTDAEWETVSKGLEGGTWKDEWITINMTLPITGILLGAFYAACTGNSVLLDGAVDGIKALNEAGIPMPELMTATVFAGLGLKLWRSQ